MPSTKIKVLIDQLNKAKLKFPINSNEYKILDSIIDEIRYVRDSSPIDKNLDRIKKCGEILNLVMQSIFEYYKNN